MNTVPFVVITAGLSYESDRERPSRCWECRSQEVAVCEGERNRELYVSGWKSWGILEVLEDS